jgi:hypothetical protein
MNLETYYLLAMSVAATLFSIATVVGIVISIWLVLRIKQILAKLDQLTTTSAEMAHHVRDLVVSTTDRIAAIEKTFLTAQGLKQVAHYLAEAFKSTQKSSPEKERNNTDG